MSRFDGYILCTAPRSGSTLLCRLLTDTGIAGAPSSLFHRPTLADWRRGLHLASNTPLPRIIAAAQLAGSAQTGMFGVRLQRPSMPFFLEQLAILHPGESTDHARIRATFGTLRYIHLTRPDKVAQAVSLLRAEQSGLWHKAANGAEIERTGPPQSPKYDATAIAAHVATFQGYDQAWQTWFAKESITPHRVSYDDLSKDPQTVLANILQALELNPAPAQGVTPGTAKLADATSADWIRRFKAAAAKP